MKFIILSTDTGMRSQTNVSLYIRADQIQTLQHYKAESSANRTCVTLIGGPNHFVRETEEEIIKRIEKMGE